MPIDHHPDTATLMAYSAGTLDEAYSVVVATHLAACALCRNEVHGLDTLGGALLQDEAEAEMSAGALDRLLGAADDAEPIRISVPEAAQDALPLPLRRYLPNGLDGVKWRFGGPGIGMLDLPTSPNAQSRLMLLKVSGGKKMPEHSHGGQELTLILKGAYTDKFGRFAFGDVADHDEDVDHQPVAEEGEACICLVALDARLNFRGRIVRALQPLIGI